MVSATFISSVPPFVSPEEHRVIIGATPGSFNDIPPVLRLTEKDVSVAFDPPLPQFTEDDGASGQLYVIESTLAFMSTAGCGFQISYPTITLHAISRPEGRRPFIYCQLDEGAGGGSDDVDLDMRELTITPQNSESLNSIFEALSACASLHPDPNTPEDEGSDDAFVPPGDFTPFTGEGEEELSEAGRVTLERLESIIEIGRQPHTNDDPEGLEHNYSGDETSS